MALKHWLQPMGNYPIGGKHVVINQLIIFTLSGTFSLCIEQVSMAMGAIVAYNNPIVCFKGHHPSGNSLKRVYFQVPMHDSNGGTHYRPF